MKAIALAILAFGAEFSAWNTQPDNKGSYAVRAALSYCSLFLAGMAIIAVFLEQTHD